MRKVLLKLSGEAFSSNESNLDNNKLMKYVNEIKKAKDKMDVSVGIVVGGGNFFRGRDFKLLGIDRERLDYMGMLGTIMNAICLEEKLKQIGVKAKALSSLEVNNAVPTYSKELANKLLSEGYVLIYGGGTGKPFFSTDTASLNKAVDTLCDEVLMAKNGVDGVYSADPKIDKNAIKYDILSHEDVVRLNLQVMDMDAAKIANENDIDIKVFDIDKDDAIYKAIIGEEIGTIIKKEI